MNVSVSELKNTVEFNSPQYDELLSKTLPMKKKSKTWGRRSEVSQLKAIVMKNATRIIQLQTELNEAGQYNHLPNLKI